MTGDVAAIDPVYQITNVRSLFNGKAKVAATHHSPHMDIVTALCQAVMNLYRKENRAPTIIDLVAQDWR